MSFEQAPTKYSAHWPQLYKTAAQALLERGGSAILNIEHIGSTAIAGLMAKPILDILVEVKPGRMSALNIPFAKLNYISKGENGIPGRSYFSRAEEKSNPAVHVHCFEQGHFEIAKHIAFRNYLRAHPGATKDYEDLKIKILSNPLVTRQEYQDYKNDFLTYTTEQALDWYANRPAQEQPVEKVVIYTLRKKRNVKEVLVFDHVKFMEVSPQVPSGTVEKRETVLEAAKRELREESGIISQSNMRFLGSYVFYKSTKDQFQERHIFALLDDSLLDEWTYIVTGNGEDRNLEFRYHWLPLETAKEKLQSQLADGLIFFAEEIDQLFA